MARALTIHPTLSSVFWPAGERAWVRHAVLAIAGSLALWVSAKIQVPFWPVPMTLQTLVVLMLGMAYGVRLGLATVLLYLAEGAAGLPVFASTPERGIGLAYMLGPTGGYLLGFVLAVALVGYLAERGWDRSVPGTAAAMIAGHVLMFLPGIAWLAVLMGWGRAVDLGFTPFILATILKTALGFALMPAAWSIVRHPE
jgi:biotin transport system substrate-specific component